MEEKGSIGEFLRSEREKRHISIEQVASATKIGLKLLHALEADNFDALPAKPFVRGFITSYCRYVGLQPDDVLRGFETSLTESAGKKFKRSPESPHIFVEQEGQGDNSKTVLSVVMVGFLVTAVIVFVVIKPSLKHKKGRAKEKTAITNEELVTVLPPPIQPAAPASATNTVPPPGQAQGTAASPPSSVPGPQSSVPASDTVTAAKPSPTPTIVPTPIATIAAQPKPAPTPAPAPSPTPTQAAAPIKVPPIPDHEVKQRLVVRAVEDSWVRYQADDRPIQAFTLKKDKTIYIRARDSIRFTTGNPRGLEISPNNQGFKPFEKTTRLYVLPSGELEKYKGQPFVPPATADLSTSN